MQKVDRCMLPLSACLKKPARERLLLRRFQCEIQLIEGVFFCKMKRKTLLVTSYSAPVFTAVCKAISIICVKLVCRSCAVQASPVKGQSEMVQRASAFFPARAAVI